MRARFILLAGFAMSAHAQTTAFWEFPNFSNRVAVVVRNEGNGACECVAVAKLSAIQSVADGFPGTLLLAADDETPSRAVATQVDAERDELALAVPLQGEEQRTVYLYYSQTLHNSLPVVARVFASHSYGYNQATAALESEKIGYRTYGALMLDVQAHAKAEFGLDNERLGFASIGHPLREGHDVVHTGSTLGLGGLFLRANGKVYQPPFSTPDYTHKAPKPNEPTYRVLEAGPLRAIVEERVANWELDGDAVDARVEYEIDAGQEVVRCRWWITPLHLSRSYEIGSGVRDLDPGKVREGNGMVVTSGVQVPGDGAIALGIAFPASAKRVGVLATAEAGSEAVVFAQKLEGKAATHGEYVAAAAWEGSGWNDPAAHLMDLLQTETHPPAVMIGKHERNPNPRALESEPK